jgi:hypothetical protein
VHRDLLITLYNRMCKYVGGGGGKSPSVWLHPSIVTISLSLSLFPRSMRAFLFIASGYSSRFVLGTWDVQVSTKLQPANSEEGLSGAGVYMCDGRKGYPVQG